MNVIYVGNLCYLYVLLFVQSARLLFLGACWFSFIYPRKLFIDSLSMYFMYVNFELFSNKFYLNVFFVIVLFVAVYSMLLNSKSISKQENILSMGNRIKLLSFWVIILSVLQGCNFIVSGLYHMQMDSEYATLFPSFGEFIRTAIRICIMHLTGHFLVIYSIFRIYVFYRGSFDKSRQKS